MRFEYGPYPFDEFTRVIKARLARGFQEYGDESFDRPIRSLLEEVEQELLDVVGWSYVLWSKVRQVRDGYNRLAR